MPIAHLEGLYRRLTWEDSCLPIDRQAAMLGTIYCGNIRNHWRVAKAWAKNHPTVSGFLIVEGGKGNMPRSFYQIHQGVYYSVSAFTVYPADFLAQARRWDGV